MHPLGLLWFLRAWITRPPRVGFRVSDSPVTFTSGHPVPGGWGLGSGHGVLLPSCSAWAQGLGTDPYVAVEVLTGGLGGSGSKLWRPFSNRTTTIGDLTPDQERPGRGPVPIITLPGEIARELRITEGAVKVAIHRIRLRFREAVRSEIAQTLPQGADPEEELRYLIDVLAESGG